jgi:hypothetical protein
MKMHLLVCTLVTLFTQRCCNMIVQTVGLEWCSHGLPTMSCDFNLNDTPLKLKSEIHFSLIFWVIDKLSII